MDQPLASGLQLGTEKEKIMSVTFFRASNGIGVQEEGDAQLVSGSERYGRLLSPDEALALREYFERRIIEEVAVQAAVLTLPYPELVKPLQELLSYYQRAGEMILQLHLGNFFLERSNQVFSGEQIANILAGGVESSFEELLKLEDGEDAE